MKNALHRAIVNSLLRFTQAGVGIERDVSLRPASIGGCFSQHIRAAVPAYKGAFSRQQSMKENFRSNETMGPCTSGMITAGSMRSNSWAEVQPTPSVCFELYCDLTPLISQGTVLLLAGRVEHPPRAHEGVPGGIEHRDRRR